MDEIELTTNLGFEGNNTKYVTTKPNKQLSVRRLFHSHKKDDCIIRDLGNISDE